jgi:hypothetical protein
MTAIAIIFEDWLADQFGSHAAAKAELDRLDRLNNSSQSCSALTEGQELAMNLELKWQQAVCEEAGIPYDGWQTYAGNCAYERMKTNQAEEESYKIIHMSSNRITAFQYWQQRMSGWNNYGPYGFHPNIDPEAYDHSEP